MDYHIHIIIKRPEAKKKVKERLKIKRCLIVSTSGIISSFSEYARAICTCHPTRGFVLCEKKCPFKEAYVYHNSNHSSFCKSDINTETSYISPKTTVPRAT